jgi:hypothetical protein
MKIAKVIGAFGNGKIFTPEIIVILIAGACEQVMHFNGLYQSWPQIGLICNSLSIYAMTIQLVSILISRVLHNDDQLIRALQVDIRNFNIREEQTENYRSILSANLKASEYYLKLYMVVCFILFSSVHPIAWTVSWYSGEFIMFTPVYLPFTDPHTLFGYVLNSILMLMMTLVPYIIFTAVYTTSIFFSFQSKSMTEIHCAKWMDFGIKINDNDKVKRKRCGNKRPRTLRTKIEKIAEREARLRTIEKQFKTLMKEFDMYNEYLNTAFSFIEFHTFLIVSVNSLAIALSIVTLLYYSKGIGGILMIYFIAQVLVPCIQGTMVVIQKEKILDELWKFPWYKLSGPQQKIFLQLMHRCQQSKEYEIFIIGNLNMELFTKVMNGAYSYFMFLWNFTV